MEIGVVKKQIKDNTLDKFYIFTGVELEAQRIYINKMAEVTHRVVQRIDSIGEIYNKQRSLISKPKCYVCRDDKDFIKAEKAWTTIDDVLGDNMLILLLTDADKRTKFYKHFSEKIVEFNYLPESSLKKYISRQIDLSDYWCSQLIDVCESDYSRILSEIDKIKRYMDYKDRSSGVTADKAMSDLLQQGAIHVPPQDAIFDYVDAVLMHNPSRAFSLLEECKLIGEPSLKLVMVLYNNAKKTLQVQACESKDVSGSTGLSGWDIKCVQGKVGRWTNGDLVYMMRLLRQVEKGIKTGTIEDESAMDYIMVNIF